MLASRASRARPSSKGLAEGVAELSASIPHVTRVPCEPKMNYRSGLRSRIVVR